MSFEDDMIEEGFRDEQDYLDYLCEEAESRRERINESLCDEDDNYKQPPHFDIDERSRLGLMLKCQDGGFAPIYQISARIGNRPLKAGHFVYGPRFNYIDMDNAIIIPAQYDQVDYFRDGIARCHKGQRWVLINELCEELPLNEDDSIDYTFSFEGKRFYMVKRLGGGPSGLINEKGDMLLPTIFRNILVKFDNFKPYRFELQYDTDTFNVPSTKFFTLKELLKIVKGPSGYLDWEKDPWPEEIIPFVDGVRAIRRNGKWGFEKQNGEMLIDCQFTKVQHFRDYYDHELYYGDKRPLKSRMLSVVEKDGWNSGCIDLSGVFVFHIRENVRLHSLKPNYPSFRKIESKLMAEYFNSDIRDIITKDSALVQTDGSFYIRNDRGFHVPSKYDWGVPWGDFIYVVIDGLWGLIDKYGEEILPCKYNESLFDEPYNEMVRHKLYVLKKNDKYGKVNHKGEIVVPFIYDDLDSLPEE